MSSFSRFGKVEANRVKSNHSDQISESDGGKPYPNPGTLLRGNSVQNKAVHMEQDTEDTSCPDPTALLLQRCDPCKPVANSHMCHT